jgi:hypothetical protein
VLPVRAGAGFATRLSADLNEAIDQKQDPEEDDGAKNAEAKHEKVAAIQPSLVHPIRRKGCVQNL